MQYYKKILLSLAFVILAITVSYGVEAYGSMSEINDKIIRLHVIANSDTDEDQELKLKVRDEIISDFNKEFQNSSSKKESENIIIDKIKDIRLKAEEVIAKEGYDYKVNVYYGNYKFPRKQYEDIVLPEGNYDAVRIEIGSAIGQNWWCVMFPQLCFVDFGNTNESKPIFDIDTESKLQEILTEEEIALIKTKRGLEEITVKSKVFEFIERGRIENTGVYASDIERTYAFSLSYE